MRDPSRFGLTAGLSVSALLHLLLAASLLRIPSTVPAGSSQTRTISATLPVTPFSVSSQETPELAGNPADHAGNPPEPEPVRTPAPDPVAPPWPAPAAKPMPRTAPAPEVPTPAEPHRQIAKAPVRATARPVDRLPAGLTKAADSPYTGSAGAASTEDSRSQIETRYLAELQEAIAAHRFYPPTAQARRIQGEATVTFVLDAAGDLTQAQVRESSGHAILDRAALETLQRLGHFKPIPLALERTQWPIRVPIHFALP